MPAYVLIRETKKERRAPLRACIAAVAGLGLAGAVLGGTAYGPALAAGLLRFVPVPAPDFQRVSEPSDRIIRIKADSNGQYYVKGSADGVPLEFMIDSGASYIVLPKEVAERLHVGPLNFDLTTNTANGQIRNAQITIRTLSIGPYTASEVSAVVNGGELDVPLLGMSWLRRFRSIEIENGVMTLHY
ncbi:MAG TPA: TIGR02281 family clan AA aspartic protease [Bryobacteraceae bacterium]|jgi:clan AA aspartic protease (TIGR02281 family)